MFGRCALRLRQCIPFARKRGVLSRRSAAGSGSLVARHRQVHAPCETEIGNGHKRRSAKQADRHGVLGYKGARRKRLAHRNASRGRRGWSSSAPRVLERLLVVDGLGEQHPHTGLSTQRAQRRQRRRLLPQTGPERWKRAKKLSMMPYFVDG